jgi:putative endonuclease
VKGGTRRIGREGEGVAKAYLQAVGYRVLHENYATRLGEIDLIALDGDVTAFVEVKSRRSLRFGLPQTSITVAKQRQIVKAATLFLERQGLTGAPCRFDVVAVTFRKGEAPEVVLIRDAFDIDGAPTF